MGYKDYDHEADKFRNGPSGKGFGSKKNVTSANDGQPTKQDKKKNSENRRYDEEK